MQEKYDYIVIGGGVVGAMIARWLSRYEGSLLLIEKEPDLGMGCSSANTAIVHAGYDPLPGSLKALMNVRANPMWDQLAGELNFPFERRGDYVVAVGEEELPLVERLMKQGVQNGVPGMLMIDGAEMRSRERDINPEVSGALWATTGGICDPFQVTVAAAESAVINGATVMLNTAFENFIWEGTRVIGVKTNRGDFFARWVINSAGIYSDDVMHKAGVRPEFFIKPRKGEYFIFDRAEVQIHNVLFPVPSSRGKGILVTGTLHENTIVGPNANVIDDKEDTSLTKEGMDELLDGARKLIPTLDLRHSIANFAGLRPMGNGPAWTPGLNYNNDYVIEIPATVQGFVNLGGIESPGLTSAPAIAEMVVDLMKDAGETFVAKKTWDPIRPGRPRYARMTHQERKLLCDVDPRYARVICRCENVTEGEIIAEMHAPVPSLTYDAIKRRTWLGTGRCQAGFDMTRVVAIMARELGVSVFDITKRGEGSEYLYRTTKDAEVADVG